jgi:hypothetical protein
MPQLSFIERDRARFHLGYASYSGIPAQDVAQLEEALNEIDTNTIYKYILAQLNMCEKAWEATNQIEERAGEKSIFVGDINRTNVRWNLGSEQRRWNVFYDHCVEELATTLHVFNYRSPEIRNNRFERWGSEYINAIPGPADTSISDHITIQNELIGGFGW